VLHSGILWPYLQTLERLESPARDKHCSLLQTLVNDSCNIIIKLVQVLLQNETETKKTIFTGCPEFYDRTERLLMLRRK
jgi:hypothetical protein